MRLSSISALALAAALSFGAVATAQETPLPPAARQGWDDESMHKHMQEHHAVHVKAFHDALNIRPDQEAGFNAAVTAMHPQGAAGDHDRMGADHDKMADHAAVAAVSTPERLDAMVREMDEHMARTREHMQRTVSAVKALYAILSPDQRRTFDALASLHHMGGMGHEHGMSGMDHGPMGGDRNE